MIEELIEILRKSGFDVSAEDIADILWLATHTEQGIAYRVQSSVEEIQAQEAPSLAQKSMAKRPRRGKERQEPEDPPIESLADVYLHPPDSTSGSVAGKGGLAFRSPAAPALPNSLGIVRALRPLKQRIPSHTRNQLDERATVRQIAEQNIWFPVLKPVMQPWLDVALVIDEGASMLPWRQTIHEFRLLLERLGAFRDVRIWGLVTDAEDQNLLLLTGKTFSRQHRQSHSPRELIDQSGLRLIFVITDCVSPAWYNATASQMLNDWGKYHPVTLLQVLPQRLWLRTALGNNEGVRLRTHIPGVANRKLQVQYISTHPTKLLMHTFPLPIVTLEPRAFSSWVKALFEMEEAWVPGTLFAVDTEQLDIQEKLNDEASINEIKESSLYSYAAVLQYFKATASPLAYRLAQLLAATSISLPIARIVQRTMLPASQQVHLAEVFLSGLLEQITPEEEISDPDYTQYDFKEGVRAELLDSLSTITMVQVLRSISDFVENRSGHALDFRALLADPTSKGNITINEVSQPFAQVGANVLRRLGGKYIALANRLQKEATIASHEQPHPWYRRLRNERDRRGLTQERVAEHLDVSVRTVQKWESGIAFPHFKNQLALVSLFGRSLEELGFSDQAQIANIPYATSRLPPLQTSVDWGNAPITEAMYGREEEFALLSKWIKEDKCQVIAILGMGGIGKTVLASHLVELLQITKDFDYIFWRSLHNAPTLDNVVQQAIEFLSQRGMNTQKNTDESILLLLTLLREKRCLLILDNFEAVLKGPGEYREGYHQYGDLIQKLGENLHKSCLLLTSREKPPEIAHLEERDTYVRSFILQGLKENEASKLLSNAQLFGSDIAWSTLSMKYDGNPLALKLVAQFIHEVFNGDIQAFLNEGATVFGDISAVLDQQFKRLSQQEEDILYWLAIAREGLSLSTINMNYFPPTTKRMLMEALTALRRRSFIEANNENQFTLQPIIMEFATNRLVEQIYDEIVIGAIRHLESHALMQAQAKDYIRESQRRLILAPLVRCLYERMNRELPIERLINILSELRRKAASDPDKGYGAGNILNILVHLHYDLSGGDFTFLTVRQAYLQDAILKNANFAYSDFSTSVFAEIFGRVLCLALNSDGTLLAAGTVQGEIWLWQIGEQIIPLRVYEGHTDKVCSIAFSPDSTQLVSGGDDDSVRLWAVSTGETLALLQEQDPVHTVAFHPNGKSIVYASNEKVRLCTRSLDHLVVSESLIIDAQTFVFSTDGKRLITGDKAGNIRTLLLDTDDLPKSVLSNKNIGVSISAIAINIDNALIAITGNDGAIELRNTTTMEPTFHLRGHTNRVRAFAFDMTQNQLLASASDDHTIRIWNIRSGECLRILIGHNDKVSSLGFSPNGRLLISGSEDYSIRLWDTDTGRCEQTLRSGEISQKPYEHMNITGAKGLTEMQKVALKALGALEHIDTELGSATRLSASDKSDLVDLLLACPAMQDSGSRETILHQLSDSIGSKIVRSSTDRIDVLMIIDRCLEYPNGLRQLIDLVRAFEAGSRPLQNLDAFLLTISHKF